MNITNYNRTTLSENILRTLRALMSNHVLTFGKALQRAELQATLPTFTRSGVLT